MPKLDSKGRLQIPLDLIHKLSVPLSTEIAVGYEYGKFVLLNSDAISNHKIISFKKLDNQRRISFSNRILAILDANMESEFLVYFSNDHIYMEVI